MQLVLRHIERYYKRVLACRYIVYHEIGISTFSRSAASGFNGTTLNFEPTHPYQVPKNKLFSILPDGKQKVHSRTHRIAPRTIIHANIHRPFKQRSLK